MEIERFPEHTVKPCPSCGRCPTCGQGPAWPVYYQTWYNYQFPMIYPGITTSGEGTVTFGSIS